MTKPSKSQRRAIYEAGLLWLDAMRQQFVNINRQGRVAESRQRGARGRAVEALAALRCVMAQVKSENGVVAVPERPADPLYRLFRVGEAVVGGMVVWFDDAEWKVESFDPQLVRLTNFHFGTMAKCRQVLHSTALLRIDGKDGGK